MIDSGNDAALVLAEGLAGSEEGFVVRMNKRAGELGLVKSRFGNPWGKAGDDQKVTAREMAKLAQHVIDTYPEYYKYFGEKEFTWNNIRQQNRNPLLTMSIGADGLKTGNIEKGEFGLVGSAVQDGRRLIVAVYGAKTAKERAEEARKLLPGVSAISRSGSCSRRARLSGRRRSMAARRARSSCARPRM